MRKTENVVRADMIEPAERNQMADGQFTCAAFIAGVHGLGGAEDLCDLGLRQVCVLTQIAYHSHIVFHKAHRPRKDTQYSNIVNIFTIDFSKYIYYN